MRAAAVTAPPAGRIQFDHLDGIRGVATLLVVFYHAFIGTGRSGQAEAELPIVGVFLGWGYLGVPVFIVLSGFVLMLPLLRSEGLSFPGGVERFLRRRARRILPPYYAALLLSLLLIWAVPVMQQAGGTKWDSKVPVTIPSLVSHLLLVHDLHPWWIYKINGSLWSVAVEWQIYFLMPLVLIPLWRRLRPPVVILLLVAATVVLPAVAGAIPEVHPWFVALFAMGMFAAQVALGHRESRRTTVLGAAGIAALLVLAYALGGDDPRSGLWLQETVIGLGAATALAVTGARIARSGTFPGRGVLASRTMVYAGTVSYSVFLLHAPLLAAGNYLLLPMQLPILEHWAIMTFVIAPLAIGVCWLFYQAVERHFRNTHQRIAVPDHRTGSSNVAVS